MKDNSTYRRNRFFSEYEHKINVQKQVTVPAAYRDEGKAVFHLVKGGPGCIYMYTNEEIDRILERLQGDPRASDPHFMRMLSSRIRTVKCDPAGRIVLPQELRQHAAIEDTAVFVGATKRIEMWNPERWKSYKKKHASSYETRFDSIVEDIFERQR